MKDETTSTNVAVKITMPENQTELLDLYAKVKSQSRSEIIRDSVSNMLNSDAAWNASLYFFKKNKAKDQKEILSLLQNSPRGTLIKVVCFNRDTPDRANVMIGNLIAIRDKKIYLDIPFNYRPTTLNTNTHTDQNLIKLNESLFSYPMAEETQYGFRWIHCIEAEYVWDIDKEIPNFMST